MCLLSITGTPGTIQLANICAAMQAGDKEHEGRKQIVARASGTSALQGEGAREDAQDRGGEKVTAGRSNYKCGICGNPQKKGHTCPGPKGVPLDEDVRQNRYVPRIHTLHAFCELCHAQTVALKVCRTIAVQVLQHSSTLRDSVCPADRVTRVLGACRQGLLAKFHRRMGGQHRGDDWTLGMAAQQRSCIFCTRTFSSKHALHIHLARNMVCNALNRQPITTSPKMSVLEEQEFSSEEELDGGPQDQDAIEDWVQCDLFVDVPATG